MTKANRILRFVRQSIGAPLPLFAEEFNKLFCGDLIGGYHGFGYISYRPESREATIYFGTAPDIDGGSGCIVVSLGSNL